MELTKNFDAFEARNTVVFAISADDLTDASYLAGTTGVRFPILYNPSRDVVEEYEVFNLLGDNLPTASTFVIDETGVIRWKYIGRSLNDRPSVGEIISQLDNLNG